jgi:hypothetical protein
MCGNRGRVTILRRGGPAGCGVVAPMTAVEGGRDMTEVNVDKLREFAGWLASGDGGQVVWDFLAVQGQVANEGVDTSGFETSPVCVLRALTPAMDELNRWVGQYMETVLDRLQKTADGLQKSASEYESGEQRNIHLITKALQGGAES